MGFTKEVIDDLVNVKGKNNTPYSNLGSIPLLMVTVGTQMYYITQNALGPAINEEWQGATGVIGANQAVSAIDGINSFSANTIQPASYPQDGFRNFDYSPFASVYIATFSVLLGYYAVKKINDVCAPLQKAYKFVLGRTNKAVDGTLDVAAKGIDNTLEGMFDIASAGLEKPGNAMKNTAGRIRNVGP